MKYNKQNYMYFKKGETKNEYRYNINEVDYNSYNWPYRNNGLRR